MTIPARKGHNHTCTTGRRLLIKQDIDTTYQLRASVVAVSTDLRGLPSTGRIDVKFLLQNCGGEKSVDALCVDDLYVNPVAGYDGAGNVFTGFLTFLRKG